LTAFTARSIKKGYDDFVQPKTSIDEIILSGGGCRNDYLLESIRGLFGSIPVKTSDEFGIPADAKEAIGFAVLANETICGNPSNVPAVTGASRPVVLGKIIP
jgi:anhydro-N-acetylmuramic acid kinase